LNGLNVSDNRVAGESPDDASTLLMKDPRDLLPGFLLALTGGFLVLVFVAVCRDAAQTRAQMEAAIAAAQKKRLVAHPPSSSAAAQKCVTGQIHGPDTFQPVGDPLAPN
jgi:hypothetical protein